MSIRFKELIIRKLTNFNTIMILLAFKIMATIYIVGIEVIIEVINMIAEGF
jgi:hypothetical protein